MPNSDKNIVIVPFTGNANADPMIVFTAANANNSMPITVYAYPDANGTLSFEGSAGQLFSITNDLSGTIFAINDVSGIPLMQANANGEIYFNQFGGNTTIQRRLTVDYPNAQGNIALTIRAANTVGGTGYADVLRFINASNVNSANITKTIRLNNTGAIEIVNSAYSAVSLTLTDMGDLSIAGNVTMSGIRPGYSAARPSFRVYGTTTTSYSITTNGTGFCNASQWTVEHNQGSYLSAANGVFSVPVTGIYQINVIGRNAGNTAGISQLVVVKNATSGNGAGGTIVTMLEFAASSTMNHAGTSTSLLLNAGDTLVMKVTAGTIQFDSNDSWSVTYLG